MINRLLLLFLTITIATTSFAQDLSIATFNCEFLLPAKVHMKYGLPFDMKYAKPQARQEWRDERFRQSKFEEAVKKVAAHLKVVNADVLGLTEVGSRQDVQKLVQALKALGVDYPHWTVCKSDDTATGQHVALLSKYPLEGIEANYPQRGLYFTESDADQVDETGLSKAMKATVTVQGNKIHCFVLHLKSERGGEDSDQRRLKQAELARCWSLPYLQKGEHVVIMGDLNSERRHTVLRTLRGFEDIFPELLQTGDINFFVKPKLRWTYNYKGQYEQLDHILLSLTLRDLCKNNDPKQGNMGIQTTIIPTTDPLVSDHNAVRVSFDFK